MTRPHVCIFFWAFTVALCCVLSSCKQSSPVESGVPELKSLTDSIPYDKLVSGKLVFERITRNGDFSGVCVIDIDSRKTWQTESGIFNGPCVSPDGKRIAYTTYTSLQTAYDVHVMNIDGTNRQQVSSMEGQEHCPSWSSDGQQVYFVALPPSPIGSCLLYRRNLASGSADPILVADMGRFDLPSLYSSNGPVSVSPTGQLIVVLSGAPGGIYRLNPPQLIVAYTSALASPAWSPDGQSFAYLSLGYNQSTLSSISVLIASADGKNTDTLVTVSCSQGINWNGDNTYSLCWSPDGAQIAFTRPEGVDVGSHICLVNKNGGGLTQITTAPGVTDRSLSWSR